ncbi:ribosome small subunit-dependent GTPase A [Clostridium sp. D2Q-11]|uniref:Small ribosomal subunit biogenesis GTPase RsgA n=1 Tax=Anaeromonas frigoriresistens TaxID=2683708 RepID=A0A942UXR7_9FIRM|nr:ribosome small subunit-dependent GTPase A [Anaeromonas frigoriresistens]MBS4539530.1 ribosome small subunit-dependent GTPase A [Anaeromonas frigoriresistens]
MSLINLGWNDFFQDYYNSYGDDNLTVGRISAEYRNHYEVITEIGEIKGEISGKLRYTIETKSDFPVVGDWVVINRLDNNFAIINDVLPRKSMFKRKAPGNKIEEQILASNIDYIFIVTSLNQNYNLRRIERYVTISWESGAIPVVILSKSDLCDDKENKIIEVENIAPGVDIHAISAMTGKGVENLSKYVKEGNTICLLGSSGVGKSTLVNRLIGEDTMDTGDIRLDDGRGKHTTTHRQMMNIPEGGLIIDTPGIREIALWDGDNGIEEAFKDLEILSNKCKFTDCKHESEPGCAITQAINNGSLAKERLDSYKKLQRELRYIERKQNRKLQLEEKKKNKSLNKYIKAHKRK